jgi:hypothetical protein
VQQKERGRKTSREQGMAKKGQKAIIQTCVVPWIYFNSVLCAGSKLQQWSDVRLQNFCS